MATYPIKMLKDEQNQPFVPLVSAESIYTNDDLSFEEKFATKLEADNLKEGNGIILEQNGNDTTISVDFGATDNIIDNLNTTVAGQGPLDARQGNVLKNMIPTIVDNLDSTDATKVLSANQGHELREMSVPIGGATGQVLKKASNNDHELEWGDAADPNAIVGDGSIMKIIELTYAEYKTLESNGELKEDTEYHITDVENGTASYVTEEQIQEMIDDSITAIGDIRESTFSNIAVTERTTLTTLTLSAGIWIITAHCQYQVQDLRWYLSITNAEIQMGAYDNSGWVDGQIAGIVTPAASTTYTLLAWTMDANGDIAQTTCSTGYLRAVRIK